MPQWDEGQLFIHRDTGLEFQVIDVSILRPEGHIGYKLKPLKDCGLQELRRLESELERDFIPGEPT